MYCRGLLALVPLLLIRGALAQTTEPAAAAAWTKLPWPVPHLPPGITVTHRAGDDGIAYQFFRQTDSDPAPRPIAQGGIAFSSGFPLSFAPPPQPPLTHPVSPAVVRFANGSRLTSFVWRDTNQLLCRNSVLETGLNDGCADLYLFYDGLSNTDARLADLLVSTIDLQRLNPDAPAVKTFPFVAVCRLDRWVFHRSGLSEAEVCVTVMAGPQKGVPLVLALPTEYPTERERRFLRRLKQAADTKNGRPLVFLLPLAIDLSRRFDPVLY